jgi:hypothetical protein
MHTLDAIQKQVQNEKPLGEMLEGNTKNEMKAKAEASRKARKQPK